MGIFTQGFAEESNLCFINPMRKAHAKALLEAHRFTRSNRVYRPYSLASHSSQAADMPRAIPCNSACSVLSSTAVRISSPPGK